MKSQELQLREEFSRPMARRGIEAERAELIREVQRLQETHLKLQGQHFVIRSRTQGVVVQLVRCVATRLPATIRQPFAGGMPVRVPVPVAASPRDTAPEELAARFKRLHMANSRRAYPALIERAER